MYSSEDLEQISPYENIYKDDIKEQRNVLKRFEQMFEKREQKQSENDDKSHHVIQNLDPLFSVLYGV